MLTQTITRNMEQFSTDTEDSKKHGTVSVRTQTITRNTEQFSTDTEDNKKHGAV